MGIVTLVVGILGNVTAMLLFMSPIPTFWEIIRKRNTGSYSAIPYLCTFSNCLLWSFYGLPMVTTNNILVLTINGSGTLFESIYLAIYLTFADKKLKGQILLMITGILGFVAIVVIVTLEAVAVNQRDIVVGSIALILNTAMYASPLSVMKLVITTKSVKSMPFLLSFCTLINSCLWAAYGIYKKDKFIIIPNVLGVLFGMVQLALYGYYRNGKEEDYKLSMPTSDTDTTTPTPPTDSTIQKKTQTA